MQANDASKNKTLTGNAKMFSTTPIRRNADGQQNLTDLRKALAASPHSIYSQGGNWIMQQWSGSHGAYLEQPAPHYWTERQAIQKVLFGEVKSADEAKYHAAR